MVTVVGPDHQTILARVAQNVGQIIRVLAGHPHVIGGERIDRKCSALTPVTVGEIVQNIGHPLRVDLDEAPADLRELFRQLFFDQRMTRADDGQLELGKTRVVGEEVVMEETAVGRMDADRQVEIARHLPERIKIRRAERAFALQAAHEDAAGAVGLGPLELVPHRGPAIFPRDEAAVSLPSASGPRLRAKYRPSSGCRTCTERARARLPARSGEEKAWDKAPGSRCRARPCVRGAPGR
jgi:hypothetical protein